MPQPSSNPSWDACAAWEAWDATEFSDPSRSADPGQQACSAEGAAFAGATVSASFVGTAQQVIAWTLAHARSAKVAATSLREGNFTGSIYKL